MKEILIRSNIRNYKVKFFNSFNFFKEFQSAQNYVVVTGTVVYQIYRKKLFDKFPKKNLIIVPLNEKRKTLTTVVKLYQRLLKKTAKKNLTLITFGGGINQDVCGFVASTLYRGIKWIYVPTTLLAQADSAIGGKTGLNFHSYKNVLGTFYPPSEIYVNVDFLKTLKKKDFYSGVGEIIKFYLMKKNALKDFDRSVRDIQKLVLLKNKNHVETVIKQSIETKLMYAQKDEFDLGKRNLLNYGHEFGHALESTSSFTIPHGIAVIVGIIFANFVAKNRGYLKKDIVDRINKKMLLPYLPTDVIKLRPAYFKEKHLIEKIKKDKKRVSKQLPLILPRQKLQLIKVTNVTSGEFKENLNELVQILKPYFASN